MSGHSKWSKVKHQKATTDVVKGQAFTKASRLITLAVREGGSISDPNLNFRLRLAIDKARAVNMPKDNIERAIERGIGTEGTGLEYVILEGYGPGGVALYIEGATDNHQRIVGLVKHVFDRGGGSMASPGSVAFLFKRAGVITVPKHTVAYDTLLNAALEAGAQDIVEMDDVFEIYTEPQTLDSVSKHLNHQGIASDNTELIMKPTITVPVDEGTAKHINEIVGELEGFDDVQRVYTNAA